VALDTRFHALGNAGFASRQMWRAVLRASMFGRMGADDVRPGAGRGSPPGPGLRQRSLALSFAGFTTTRMATVSRPSAR
jgi:hypothetical protein